MSTFSPLRCFQDIGAGRLRDDDGVLQATVSFCLEVRRIAREGWERNDLDARLMWGTSLGDGASLVMGRLLSPMLEGLIIIFTSYWSFNEISLFTMVDVWFKEEDYLSFENE